MANPPQILTGAQPVMNSPPMMASAQQQPVMANPVYFLPNNYHQHMSYSPQIFVNQGMYMQQVPQQMPMNNAMPVYVAGMPMVQRTQSPPMQASQAHPLQAMPIQTTTVRSNDGSSLTYTKGPGGIREYQNANQAFLQKLATAQQFDSEITEAMMTQTPPDNAVLTEIVKTDKVIGDKTMC